MRTVEHQRRIDICDPIQQARTDGQQVVRVRREAVAKRLHSTSSAEVVPLEDPITAYCQQPATEIQVQEFPSAVQIHRPLATQDWRLERLTAVVRGERARSESELHQGGVGS